MKKILTHLQENKKDELEKITNKEQKLFDLLDYAYIGARYNADYRIEKEELEYLSEKVRKLLEITEKTCKDKIESFEKKVNKNIPYNEFQPDAASYA